MAAINPELKNRKNRDGRYPIYIRVSSMLAGRQAIQRVASGQYVTVKRNFNANGRYGNWITAAEPGADKINKELKAKIERIREQFARTGAIDLPAMTGGGFFPYAAQYAEQFNNERSYGTYVQYQAKLSKLARYLGFKREKFEPIPLRLAWEDITPQFIRSYVIWLRSEGNGVNTIAVDLRKIRAVFTSAIREDVTELRNPFDKIEIKTEPAKKERLSKEELDVIRKLDLSQHPKALIARDVFLFCINCLGMRIGDAVSLRVGEVTEAAHYQMRKTGHWAKVKLNKEAREIAERNAKGRDADEYLFSFYFKKLQSPYQRISSCTARVNTQLKFIASLAKIPKRLSTHVSRHTFAQLALDSSSNPRTIQKALRHSNFSTTEAYLRDLNNDDVDEMNEAIFGK